MILKTPRSLLTSQIYLFVQAIFALIHYLCFKEHIRSLWSSNNPIIHNLFVKYDKTRCYSIATIVDDEITVQDLESPIVKDMERMEVLRIFLPM